MVPHDWSGLYVGIQAGYAIGDAGHSFSGFNPAPGGSSDPDGPFGGVHAGFLFQSDRFVYGVEGDIEVGDIDGSYQNGSGLTSSGSTDIGLQGSVRAKGGYAMDRFLPYITGGLAIADVEYGGGPAGGPCCGYSDTALGWTAGAGLQYAINDMMSARVEYRYTDYGSDTDGLPPTFPSTNMRTDLKIHAVMVGLSLQFGEF